MIHYLSTIAIPFTIFFIILYAFLEKKQVFDSFLEGAKEGLNIVYKIFPTLIALFLATNALRASGIFDLIAKLLSPILSFIKIPAQILPLMLIRPISGSASTAIAVDIMKTYGVDNIIRTYIISYYGVYRNNSLYNCHIY